MQRVRYKLSCVKSVRVSSLAGNNVFDLFSQRQLDDIHIRREGMQVSIRLRVYYQAND